MTIVLGRKPGGSGGGGGAPSGPAGGSLAGTYPNPTIAAGAVDTAEIADDAVDADKIDGADAADIRTLLDVADQDDTVLKALYDANTVLAATSDNTPAAVTMGASTILARLAAGNIKAASVAEVQALLGGTYLIEEIVVGSGGVASVDFQSIPASYRHLIIEGLAATENAATQDLQIRVNNDSGTNYFQEVHTGVGATSAAATASSQTSGAIARMGPTASSQFTSLVIDIPYYAVNTSHPINSSWGGHISPSNSVGRNMVLHNTAAVISRVTLFSTGSSDIKEGSIFSLYGRY